MSEIDANSVVTDKPKLGKKINARHVLMIVGVLVVLAIVAGFILGYLFAGVKKPNQNVVVMTNVCNTDSELKKLNGYLADITNTSNVNAAKEAIDHIKLQAGYESDPTCIEALNKFSYIDRDFAALESYVNQLKSFADKGQYPSNKFDGTSNLYTNEVNYQMIMGGSR